MLVEPDVSRKKRPTLPFALPDRHELCTMPNRGPMPVSLAEVTELLAEMPPPMDPREAEDDEERQRFALQAKIRSHLEEPRKALEAAGAASTENGTVVLSVDEVDELLDSLPPPPALAAVRERLAGLRLQLLS